MTTTTTTSAPSFADQASALLAAGFASEARRKEALALVSRAYDRLHRALLDQLIEQFPRDDDGVRAEPFEDLYWGHPSELHLWKPRHIEQFRAYPEVVAEAKALFLLRGEIKAALIDAKPVRQDHPLLVFARSANVDLAALRERREGEYRDALDLGRKLAGLPVNVHRVFCCNYGGAQWVRLDWYLSGKRTAFSVIAAAYAKLVEEGVIVEGER
jgi:hypothetical protein